MGEFESHNFVLEDEAQDFVYSEDVDDMEDPDQYTEEYGHIGHTNNQTLNSIGTGGDNDLCTNSEQTENIIEKKISNDNYTLNLPLSRIRALMKLDPEFNLTSSEAVFLITKATELFIDSLAKQAYVHTSQRKKKTVQKQDIDLAVSSVDSLMFLEGSMNF